MTNCKQLRTNLEPKTDLVWQITNFPSMQYVALLVILSLTNFEEIYGSCKRCTFHTADGYIIRVIKCELPVYIVI